jgi:DnaJ homolog subfamily B member 12
MFDEEISPEEMFNRFFGGGGMGGMGGGFGPFGRSSLVLVIFSCLTFFNPGGGGMFDTGPQFVFNLGGGPGFRVHQFGGGAPRRRPRQATGDGEGPAPSLASSLSNLLPLLLLVILPLLSSLFSSDAASSGPQYRFDSPSHPYTMHRVTPRFKVDYYVNPSDVAEWNNRKLSQLDQRAEVDYVGKLRVECDIETDRRQRMMQDAQGWFFQDTEKMDSARRMPLRSCRKLDEMRVGRGAY